MKNLVLAALFLSLFASSASGKLAVPGEGFLLQIPDGWDRAVVQLPPGGVAFAKKEKTPDTTFRASIVLVPLPPNGPTRFQAENQKYCEVTGAQDALQGAGKGATLDSAQVTTFKWGKTCKVTLNLPTNKMIGVILHAQNKKPWLAMLNYDAKDVRALLEFAMVIDEWQQTDMKVSDLSPRDALIYKAKAQQASAKMALAAFYTAQIAFHAEWEKYSADFHGVGYSLQPSPYSIGFFTPQDSSIAVALLQPGMTIQQFSGLAKSNCSGCLLTPTSFKAVAIGYIGVKSLDVWTIDQDKNLVNTINAISEIEKAATFK